MEMEKERERGIYEIQLIGWPLNDLLPLTKSFLIEWIR